MGRTRPQRTGNLKGKRATVSAPAALPSTAGQGLGAAKSQTLASTLVELPYRMKDEDGSLVASYPLWFLPPSVSSSESLGRHPTEEAYGTSLRQLCLRGLECLVMHPYGGRCFVQEESPYASGSGSFLPLAGVWLRDGSPGMSLYVMLTGRDTEDAYGTGRDAIYDCMSARCPLSSARAFGEHQNVAVFAVRRRADAVLVDFVYQGVYALSSPPVIRKEKATGTWK